MLSKHFEKVRQRSEDYRMIYAFSVSLLFTGVVASFWVFTWFVPDFSGVANSASVLGAFDKAGTQNVQAESNTISPTSLVKQEAGNMFGSFFDSIKKMTGNAPEADTADTAKNLASDKVLTPDSGVDTAGTAGTVNADSAMNTSENVFSTSTQSGIIIEVDKNDISGVDGVDGVGGVEGAPERI